MQICDVISRWETALREKGLGKFENRRAIRFSYRSRMHWRRGTAGESERERALLCYQARDMLQKLTRKRMLKHLISHIHISKIYIFKNKAFYFPHFYLLITRIKASYFPHSCTSKKKKR